MPTGLQLQKGFNGVPAGGAGVTTGHGLVAIGRMVTIPPALAWKERQAAGKVPTPQRLPSSKEAVNQTTVIFAMTLPVFSI
jgi:hypothetical protein